MKPRVSIVSCLVPAALIGLAASVRAESATEPVLSPWTQDMLCAPRVLPDGQTMGSVRVVGSYDGTPHTLFGTGEQLVVTSDGGNLASGQYYVAQRALRSRVWSHHEWVDDATQTAGLVRIDSVTGDTAVGTVVWACDGVEKGDRLQAYVAPQGPPPELPAGRASFDLGGDVLIGIQDRRMGSAPDLLLVARPEGQSPAPGQHVTFYRRAYGSGGPVTVLGEGTVQAVADRTFTVRIESSTSAIYTGDRAALHR